MNLLHFLTENMICAHFVRAVTFACCGSGCFSAGVGLALEISHIRSLHKINAELVNICYYTHYHNLWYRPLLQIVTNKIWDYMVCHWRGKKEEEKKPAIVSLSKLINKRNQMY